MLDPGEARKTSTEPCRPPPNHNRLLGSARLGPHPLSIPVVVGINVDARRQHGVEVAPQAVVLQGRGDPLLVGQLLGDALVLGVRPLLQLHVQPVVGRQARLEPRADRQADDGGEAAVVDGRGQVDRHRRQRLQVGAGAGRGRRVNADVGEVDHGELAEGEGVLGVGDGGDQVWRRGAGRLD